MPEVIECYDTQEHYWELQRFLVLALKSNPNVLEGLYTPLIEKTSSIGDELVAVRRGEMPWEESEAWRLRLHKEFDEALKETSLPERPDYERVNDFLVRARRAAGPPWRSEEIPHLSFRPLDAALVEYPDCRKQAIFTGKICVLRELPVSR